MKLLILSNIALTVILSVIADKIQYIVRRTVLDESPFFFCIPYVHFDGKTLMFLHISH